LNNPNFANTITTAILLCCLLPVFASPADVALASSAGRQGDSAEQPAASRTDPRKQSKQSYVITITGYNHFSEKELLESAAVELEKFTRRGYRKADIDDAAFRMKSAYLREGFAFAAVDYTYEPKADLVLVTFRVEEGPRVFIEKVRFTGNRSIESETLRDFFPKTSGFFNRPPIIFNESEVNNAVNKVREYYRGEGFKDAAVKNPALAFTKDRSEVNLTIEIEEGSRYFIDEVSLSGELIPELIPELEEIKEDYTGKTFYPRRKLLLRSSLEEAYDAAGYAAAAFDVTAPELEPGSIKLAAEITSGERITIEKIVILGNEHTRESFIRNRLQFKAGDLFTNAKRKESFRQLFDSGLFTKVTMELAPPEPDAGRTLEVTVAELPSLEVYVEPGWGSYELLRLGVGVFEKNLFGTGRNGQINGLVSTKGGNLTLSYTDPWLLKTDIAMNVPLYYERREEPSYTSEEQGLGVFFSRKLSRNLTLTTGYQYKMTQFLDLGDPSLLQQEKEDYNKGTVSIQAIRDTRDDIFYPRNGSRLAAGFDLSLPAFGSEIEFGRFTLGGRYFLELPQEYIFGVRLRTGLITPLGDQTFIPISERFFNGGDSTVRSYEHSRLGTKDINNEPLGGLGYNVFSLELRKRFYGNFAATVFVDGGNVSPNNSLPGNDFTSYTSRSELMDDTLTDFFDEFKYGIGIGFQYLLPVGPIRIDFAYNPDPEEVWNEDEWVFHFSLGMAF
jgi:outer membrane protein assembly complex protein YaeT